MNGKKEIDRRNKRIEFLESRVEEITEKLEMQQLTSDDTIQEMRNELEELKSKNKESKQKWTEWTQELKRQIENLDAEKEALSNEIIKTKNVYMYTSRKNNTKCSIM